MKTRHLIGPLAALLLGACGDNIGDSTRPEVEIDMGGVEGGSDDPVAVGEDGSPASFALSLSREPIAPVTMSITSSDVTAGIPSASELVFTRSNFSESQTVEITIVDDDIAGGDRPFTIELGRLVSDDPAYDGLPGRTLHFVSRDDDVAGIAVSDNSGMTTEGNGTATFKLALTSEPVADVILTLASDDSTEGWVNAGMAVLAPTLTFTAADWDQPQTVTAMGADDDLADGAQTYHIAVTASGDDSVYAALAPTAVPLLNADNDSAGIAVGQISGPTTEAGGTATFDVVLQSEPVSSVAVTLSSDNPGEGGSSEQLIFTAANWSEPQTATVTGADDSIDDGDADYNIELSVASGDPLYAAISLSPVAVTNTDDDTAGVSAAHPTGLATEGGGIAMIDLILSSEPLADVVLTVAIDDETEGSLSTTELTFTSDDWDQPQTIQVTGVDDAVDDGTQTVTITATAASDDPAYTGLEPTEVTLANVDDDTAAVVASPIDGPTTEAGGTATFQVVLATEPTADVTLTFLSDESAEGVAGGPITFTPEDWDTAQTVTVTGVDDAFDDGDFEYHVNIASASDDEIYAGIEVNAVAVTNSDDDTAALSMGPISGATTEAGGTATFTVVLTSQPTDDVVVTLGTSDAGEGAPSGALTFTADDWDTAQTVTVTGADDSIDDGDVGYQITASIASDDEGYAGLAIDPLAVTNTDDDTAGIAIGAISGNTSEAGGTATFTVVLDSEPLADVAVALAVDDPTEGSLDLTELTFTAEDWFTARTVTVTGLADAEADGAVAYNVTFAVSSQDNGYNEMAVAPLAVTNDDSIECSGDALDESFEDGTTGSFSLLDPSYLMAATTTAAAVGLFGLELAGSGDFYDGARATFASSTPNYVSVRMRADSTNSARSYFALGDDNIASNGGVLFFFASTSGWLISDGGNSESAKAVVADQYEHFEFFLDWDARTIDVYANSVLVIEGFPFRSGSSTDVNQLHLFNPLSPAVAEYDEIYIGCAP